jgi:hypothetical protein
MWRRVADTSPDSIDQNFALRRISEIDEELSVVPSLEGSPALTEKGRHFLRHLFAA